MKKLLTQKKPLVIGVIHLLPTLSYEGWSDLNKFIGKAKKDLKVLESGGVDAVLIENDADSPCQVEGVADVVSPMVVVVYELAKLAKIPLGIEVLLNDPKASLAIAKTCGLSFIRTDYFVDRMMRDGYGEFEIDPKSLMEYKKKIKADDIVVLTDIQVKYAKLLEKGKTISQSARQAVKVGSDCLILTGDFTGEEPKMDDLKEAREAVSEFPILVGSGFSIENAKKLLKYTDGAIVGTSIKTGDFVDEQKVRELVSLVKLLKEE